MLLPSYELRIVEFDSVLNVEMARERVCIALHLECQYLVVKFD